MVRKIFWGTAYAASLLIGFQSTLCLADAGADGSGGGQDTVVAFDGNVLILMKWLQENGKTLSPPIHAQDVFRAADPNHIIPIDDTGITKERSTFKAVTKTCDGKIPRDPSDLRTACYNRLTDNIYLSEARYSTDIGNPTALGVAAHEIFRKMGLEGDGYEISRQIPLIRSPQPCEKNPNTTPGQTNRDGSCSWLLPKVNVGRQMVAISEGDYISVRDRSSEIGFCALHGRSYVSGSIGCRDITGKNVCDLPAISLSSTGVPLGVYDKAYRGVIITLNCK